MEEPRDDDDVSVVTIVTNPKNLLKGPRKRPTGWLARNKWVLAGTGVLGLVILAVCLLLAKRSGHSSPAAAVTPTGNTTSSSNASVDASIYQLPAPDKANSSEWRDVVSDYYQRLNQSEKLNPELIDGFFEAASTLMKEKLNITLPENLPSAKTILQYLEAKQQWGIRDAILKTLDGKNLTDLSITDLANLGQALRPLFDPSILKKFTESQSIAHEHVVKKLQEGNPTISTAALLKALRQAGYEFSDEDLKAIGLANETTTRLPAAAVGPLEGGVVTKAVASDYEDDVVAVDNSTVTRGLKPPRRLAPPAAPPGPPKMMFTFPALNIPLVFHILQYPSQAKGGKRVALPPTYNAMEAAQKAVAEVNRMFKRFNTSVQFRVAEVRTDFKKFPYLMMSSAKEWQDVAAQGVPQIKGVDTVQNNNAAVDRYINVYVAGSFDIPGEKCEIEEGVDCSRGYGFVPPIGGSCEGTEKQAWQHVFIMYDEMDTNIYNKDWGGYNPGAIVLAHELGHHLGLMHVHGDGGGCTMPNDEVGDTPEMQDTQDQDWWAQADKLCARSLKGEKIDWSTQMKKFDSCPSAPGTDAIFNIMSYAPDSCRNSGVGITRGQVVYMQMKITQCRRKLYACASDPTNACYS